MLQVVTREECYSVLESYQNQADHDQFETEYSQFIKAVSEAIVACRLSCGIYCDPEDVDYHLPAEEDYPDDRTLMLCTFVGRKITKELLFELSQLVQEYQPSYHIFIDGQVSHGQSFEIVFKPDGVVCAHEVEGVELLEKLGFPS